ncbi:hypothetical protein D9756_004395 [Leucocoprinus leucothites]|uniref:Uncharacterized protein n=1 Tax=Leucocoprinus leucothites TaxID=201217 RepID=A0A8H5G0P9_9AGAR|nr:hypothetical protein D9756_004395 [Leucoagaricus leucothites]
MLWNNPCLIGVAWIALGMFEKTGWLHAAAFESNASCYSDGSEDWSWMNNKNGSSPCLTAAAVINPCYGPSYNVPPLLGEDGYEAANGSHNTINGCYCSWATYNLLAACATCQNRSDKVLTWFKWSEKCGSQFTSSNRPYPSNASIPGDMTFPKWSATNPNLWRDGRFNASEAKAKEESNPGDLLDPSEVMSSPTPEKNSNSVGAIAGGVVGGIVVIAFGIAAAIFLYCRSRRRKGQQLRQGPHMSQGPVDHHARSPSDFSAKSFGSALPYNPLGHASLPSSGYDSRILNSPTTFRTHNTSRGSLVHESLAASVSYAGTPPPQQGNPNQPNVIMTSHGVVIPFTLDRPTSSQETRSGHEKKRSEASTGGVSSTTTPHRGPMNPPAYSAAPHDHGDFSSQVPDQASTYDGSASIFTTPSDNPSRPHHERGLSSGTIGSNLSTTTGGLWTHAGSASLSGAADLISQMNHGSAPGPSGETPTYSGPSTNMVVPRDEKRA